MVRQGGWMAPGERRLICLLILTIMDTTRLFDRLLGLILHLILPTTPIPDSPLLHPECLRLSTPYVPTPAPASTAPRPPQQAPFIPQLARLSTRPCPPTSTLVPAQHSTPAGVQLSTLSIKTASRPQALKLVLLRSAHGRVWELEESASHRVWA